MAWSSPHTYDTSRAVDTTTAAEIIGATPYLHVNCAEDSPARCECCPILESRTSHFVPQGKRRDSPRSDEPVCLAVSTRILSCARLLTELLVHANPAGVQATSSLLQTNTRRQCCIQRAI